MILDEIVLQDFGVYEGRQTIRLTPPDSTRPIILIGGLNGGGKTTLLDAIQLCLFGAHATVSNRGTQGYQAYLSHCIHRGTDAGEAVIEIDFRRMIEGEEEQYRLTRAWTRTDGGCRERLEVVRNGTSEPLLAENWATQVEEYFPGNIAHLFLFDGEQVEAYASRRDASALIGSAIQNLLGLDIVDRLEKDLRVYERQKRSEKGDENEALDGVIAAMQEELAGVRKRIVSLRQEQASLQTHGIDRLRRALDEATKRYRRLGGELYDRREVIEKRCAKADDAVRDGQTEIREFVAGASPLLLVRGLLESVGERDRSEEECRRAQELSEALEVRDESVVRYLMGQAVDDSAVDRLRRFLERDRAERRALGRTETILDLVPDVRTDLHSLLREGLDDAAKAAHGLIERQAARRAEFEQARAEQEGVPSTDAIADVVAERRALKKELSRLDAEHAAIGSEIERQTRELERNRKTVSRLVETEARRKAYREDRSRILHHSEMVRRTLASFRQGVIRRHVSRIEALVLECYQQLLRKSALVTRLLIDPDNFSITLMDRNGDALSPERLSAGERQLLAVALLWGLARASGRPLPTAIDTPLGRLDSGHRMHVVERYLPYASHQVLIFSTDEEIVGEYLERLGPWIGRSYLLAYDDSRGATRVVPGYFDGREAA